MPTSDIGFGVHGPKVILATKVGSGTVSLPSLAPDLKAKLSNDTYYDQRYILRGGDTVTATIAWTQEQRYASSAASYVDPDSGVTRAIKVGAGGMAVRGGLKTDTLTTTGATVIGTTLSVPNSTTSLKDMTANTGAFGLTLTRNGSAVVAQDNAGSLIISDSAFDTLPGTKGTSFGYAREDHRHGLPALPYSTTATNVGLTSAGGNQPTVSRGDHVHGFSVPYGANVTTIAIADTFSGGSSVNLSREDHRHGAPAWQTIITTTAAFGTPASAGTSTSIPRGDHDHGLPGLPYGSAVALVLGGASSDGTGTSVARANHVHGLPGYGSPAAVGTALADGNALTVARSNHVHSLTFDATITAETSYALAPSSGGSLSPSRADHTHGTPPTPVTALTTGVGLTPLTNATGSVTIANTGVLSVSSGNQVVLTGTAQNPIVGVTTTPSFTSATIPTLTGAVSVTTSLTSPALTRGSSPVVAQDNAATTVASSSPGGASVVGTLLTYAREDHAHGLALNYGPVVSSQVFAQASASGTLATISRSDHVHGTPPTPVTSAVQGTGISVSAATGAVTFANTGVLSVTASGQLSSSGGQNPNITITPTPSFAAVTIAAANPTLTLTDTTAAQTTPTKYLQSSGGSLLVRNNAGTVSILTLTDAGALSVPSTITGSTVSDASGRVYSPGNANLATAVVASTTYGQASAVGAGTLFARDNHIHGTPPAQVMTGSAGIAATPSGVDYGFALTFVAGTTTLTPGTGTATPATEGVAGTASRVDHAHSLPPYTTAATTLTYGGTGTPGVANLFARGDHTHTMPADTPVPYGGVVNLTPTAAANSQSTAGVAGTASRSDHAHGLPAFGSTATSVPIGGNPTPGTNDVFSRQDHVHTITNTPIFSTLITTSNASVGGTFGVTGTVTLTSTLGVAGVSNLNGGMTTSTGQFSGLLSATAGITSTAAANTFGTATVTALTVTGSFTGRVVGATNVQFESIAGGAVAGTGSIAPASIYARHMAESVPATVVDGSVTGGYAGLGVKLAQGTVALSNMRRDSYPFELVADPTMLLSSSATATNYTFTNNSTGAWSYVTGTNALRQGRTAKDAWQHIGNANDDFLFNPLIFPVSLGDVLTATMWVNHATQNTGAAVGVEIQFRDHAGAVIVPTVQPARVQVDSTVTNTWRQARVIVIVPPNAVTGQVYCDPGAPGALASFKVSDFSAKRQLSTNDLLDLLITLEKLANNAVDTRVIKDLAVTLQKLADNAVNTRVLQDLSVTTTKLVNDAVTLVKMAANSVDTTKLVDSAVTLVKLASNAVDSTKIVDYSIQAIDIATAALNDSRIFPTTGSIINGAIVQVGTLPADRLVGGVAATAASSVNNASTVTNTVVGSLDNTSAVKNIKAATLGVAEIGLNALTGQVMSLTLALQGSLSTATSLVVGTSATVTGALQAASATITGNTLVQGTLDVTGRIAQTATGVTNTFASQITGTAMTLSGQIQAATANITGNATVQTLTSGATTLTGNLSGTTASFTGALSAATGSFTGSVSGGPGTFTTLTVSTGATIGSTRAFIETGSAGVRGLRITAVPGQTANLLELTDSTPTITSLFAADGSLRLGSNVVPSSLAVSSNASAVATTILASSTTALEPLRVQGIAGQVAPVTQWFLAGTGAIADLSAAGILSLVRPNSGLEIGAPTASNTPYIDFHSSTATNNYDVRLSSTGGNATDGQGTLSISALLTTTTGTLQEGANRVYSSAFGSSATVAAETAYGVAANAGSALTYSRGDHTHGTPPATNFTTDANYVHIVGAETITGAKTFSAASVFAGVTATTLTTSGATQVNSTLGVTGVSTLAATNVTGTLAVTGAITASTTISEAGNRVYSAGNANLSITTPAAVAAAGAIGTGTTYAKADHAHAGVASLTTSTGLSTNTTATGAVTITNTGVLSLTTSSGLSTNTSATGAVSITNTGVLSVAVGNQAVLTGTSQNPIVGVSTTPSFTSATIPTLSGNVSVGGTLTSTGAFTASAGATVTGAITATTTISEAGQRVYSASFGSAGTVTSETAFGQAANAGSATTYSRGDHTHGTPATTFTNDTDYVHIVGTETITGAKTFSSTVTMNGAAPTGTAISSLSEQLRSGINITGGGTVSFIGGFFQWTTRFIVMGNGYGTHFSTNGYFDIGPVASGVTITGAGGHANVTTTTSGVPMVGWDALYYILPIGFGNTFVPANLRIVGFSAALEVPDDWVLLGIYNNDLTTLWVPAAHVALDVGGAIDTTRGNHRNQYVTLTDVQTVTAAKTWSALQTFSAGLSVTGGTATIPTLTGAVTITGSLTAPNVVYSVTASGNLSSSQGQNPAITMTATPTFTSATISSTNPALTLSDASGVSQIAVANLAGSFHSSAAAGDVVVRGNAAGNTQSIVLAPGPTSTGYLRVSNAGTVISGTLNVTGNLSENGARVYSANNPPPAQTGGAATTTVTTNTYGLAAVVGTGTPYARNDHTHGTVPAQTLTQGSNIVVTPSGVNYTVATSLTPTFTSLTTTAAGVFNGGVQARSATASTGYVTLIAGNAFNAGYAEFFQPNGVRAGYIGYGSTTGATIDTGYISYVAGTHSFSGTVIIGGVAAQADTAYVHIAGTETITGSKTFNGAITHSASAANVFSQFSSHADTSSYFTLVNSAAATTQAAYTVANFTNNVDQDLQIRVTGTGATDKYSLIAPTTGGRLALGTAGVERMSINNAGLLTVSNGITATAGAISAPNGAVTASGTVNTNTGFMVASGGSGYLASTDWINQVNLTAGLPSADNPGITATLKSGFYNINNNTNTANVPTTQAWHHVLHMRHANAGNNFSHQIAASFYAAAPDLYHRKIDNGTAGPWRKIWDSSNLNPLYMGGPAIGTYAEFDYYRAPANGADFYTAHIEIREDAGAAYIPRIAFHMAGVVASQLGMSSSGMVRTYNNPGTGYEKFGASSYFVGDSGATIGSGGTYGAFTTYGSNNGWSGINFYDARSTFMVGVDGVTQGLYDEQSASWRWYWNSPVKGTPGEAVLAAGSVPSTRVSGGNGGGALTVGSIYAQTSINVGTANDGIVIDGSTGIKGTSGGAEKFRITSGGNAFFTGTLNAGALASTGQVLGLGFLAGAINTTTVGNTACPFNVSGLTFTQMLTAGRRYRACLHIQVQVGTANQLVAAYIAHNGPGGGTPAAGGGTQVFQFNNFHPVATAGLTISGDAHFTVATTGTYSFAVSIGNATTASVPANAGGAKSLVWLEDIGT